MTDPEFHEIENVGSEVFPEASQAVIRALSHPGCKTLGVFTFWVGLDPSAGEVVMAAAQSVDPGWSVHSGGTDEAVKELRAQVRRWLDTTDANEA